MFSRKCSSKYFSISNYASVSTPTSVLIIGGYDEIVNDGFNELSWFLNYNYGYNVDTNVDIEFLSSIVEYKNDEWTVIGNLKQARYGHQAISIGSLVMIIGGQSDYQL